MKKDFFGKKADNLTNKKLWLFDMDGTIYEDTFLFDGTISLLQSIATMGGIYVFITNNSSRSIEEYVKKLYSLGINVSKENFFTSSQATAMYILNNYPDSKVYCQGTTSFVNEIKAFGISVTTEDEDDVGLVLVGFDTELTSEKLRKTCLLLQNRDIPFIATNCDLRCPIKNGFVPDCGSICQMLTNATGKSPVYIGKPEPTMVEYVINKYGFAKSDVVVVGDRLYTDIATGNNAGVVSICVLTGEATVEDIKNGDVKPTYTFKSVLQVAELFDGN